MLREAALHRDSARKKLSDDFRNALPAVGISAFPKNRGLRHVLRSSPAMNTTPLACLKRFRSFAGEF
jgi:hypothetical protein